MTYARRRTIGTQQFLQRVTPPFWLDLLSIEERRWRSRHQLFFFSSRRRHTSCGRDWSQTCALPILPARGAGDLREDQHPRAGALAVHRAPAVRAGKIGRATWRERVYTSEMGVA